MIVAFSILGIVVFVLSLDPIAQDPRYHQFVDARTLLGIPNFWNVMSNLPFLLAGAYGIVHLAKHRMIVIEDIRYVYAVFCIGVALVAFGSGYYHLAPDNRSLIWDRLPMTIAFMSFFVILLCDFVSVTLGKRLFIPLILIGIASVLYWYATELAGKGDLRLYVLVQFIPLIFIPVILLLHRNSGKQISGYWYLFAAYFIAKVLEYFDKEIYQFGNVISGHSLKHFAAAIGIFLLLRMFVKGTQKYST